MPRAASTASLAVSTFFLLSRPSDAIGRGGSPTAGALYFSRQACMGGGWYGGANQVLPTGTPGCHRKRSVLSTADINRPPVACGRIKHAVCVLCARALIRAFLRLFSASAVRSKVRRHFERSECSTQTCTALLASLCRWACYLV